MNLHLARRAAAWGACLLLAGCSCREPERSRSAVLPATAAGRVTVLATLPAAAPPRAPATGPWLGMHAPVASPEVDLLFGERGGGVTWAAEDGDGFRVFHDGRAGPRYEAIVDVAISPDGRRWAHGALVDGRWHMVVDGKPGAPFDAVQSPVFSPDSQHVAYQAMAGERWYLVVDATPNPGTGSRFLAKEFSGDSARIAYIDDASDDDWGRLVVSDIAFRSPVVVAPVASGLLVNAARTEFAAIAAASGERQVVTVPFDRPEQARRGPRYDVLMRPAYAPAGSSMAYVAGRGGSTFMVLDGREEALPAGDWISAPAVRPDGKAVGSLIAVGGTVSYHQSFLAAGAPEAPVEEADWLSWSSDGLTHVYAARRADRWFIVVGGKAGPGFDRVVSPVFSPDGRRVAYRARQGGERFVVVADLEGRTIRRYPPYDLVYQFAFTADGRSIGYGIKDGRAVAWKVEDL